MNKKKIIIPLLITATYLGPFVPSSLAAGHAHQTKVKVIHASPDAPQVDVLVNDAVTLEDVPFGAASNYLEVAGGKYNLKVRPANTTGPNVINADAELAGGKSYSVVAANTLAKISPLVLAKSKAPALSHATVRIGHLIPDAPAVNITTTDGAILVGNLKFLETKEITVPTGSYKLQMRLASDNSKVVTALPTLTVNGGTNYSAYAIGTLDDQDAAKFQVKYVLD